MVNLLGLNEVGIGIMPPIINIGHDLIISHVNMRHLNGLSLVDGLLSNYEAEWRIFALVD